MQHEHKYEQLLEEAKKLELDAESCCLLKVVALFASDGSNLKGKAQVESPPNPQTQPQPKPQVERIQDDFCLLLYRCYAFNYALCTHLALISNMVS